VSEPAVSIGTYFDVRANVETQKGRQMNQILTRPTVSRQPYRLTERGRAIRLVHPVVRLCPHRARKTAAAPISKEEING
jgi:hypothetical protein